METSQGLTAATWRKSSYSSSSGGDCIECAPLGPAAWHKSTYCASSGSDCLEVAPLTPHIALRDSKNPDLGAFTVTPEAYTAFVNAAARGVL
ncbi:DUF397 domain-containing protein [Streptomyces sp. NBC_00827]|uniref:DUF397 domain-containing protein n=1 Tax=Streptomyces sp. NBC_00827 TaxID=2903677 RepID=UPI0038635438|nr:DUF397 domain-containing protein [Streptomyces sp. NBC_00827]